jgi:hypothetical protein
MDRYINSPIRLHGVVLSWLSIGTLPSYDTEKHWVRWRGKICLTIDGQSGVVKFKNTNDRGIRCADHATPSIRKSWHYFANKRRSLGRHNLLADQSHGVISRVSRTTRKNAATWRLWQWALSIRASSKVDAPLAQVLRNTQLYFLINFLETITRSLRCMHKD